MTRPGLLVLAVVALLAGALAPAAFGGTVAGPNGQDDGNVTTTPPRDVTSTTAVLRAEVEDAPDGAWATVEYRAAGEDEWRDGTPKKFDRSDGPPWILTWNVTGLQPGTTYEYRAVVATSSERASGGVETFTTPDGDEATSSPTPPCPEYSSGSALCTGTPTPTPTPTVPPEAPETVVPDPEVVTVTPSEATGPTNWLAGLAPLLTWVAVVGVVAPVVLGGLLAASRRRGRE